MYTHEIFLKKLHTQTPPHTRTRSALTVRLEGKMFMPTVPAVSVGSGKLCVARQKQSFWLLGCGSQPNASLEHSIWSVTRTAHAQLSCAPYFTNPLHVHAVPPCSWAQCSHARPVWLGSAQTSTTLGLTFAVATSANAARVAVVVTVVVVVVVMAAAATRGSCMHALSASRDRTMCMAMPNECLMWFGMACVKCACSWAN